MKPWSREAQALIDSARSVSEPSEAYRERMRRRLAAQIGGAAAAATVTATATSAAAAEAAPIKAAGIGLLTKAGLIIAALGVLAGGAALSFRDTGGAPARAHPTIAAMSPVLPVISSVSPRPSFDPSPEPRAAAPPAATTSEAPIPEATPAHPERHAGSPRRAALAAAKPSPAPRPAPGIALTEELGLLSRAQAALSSGQAAQALVLLEEHASSHPDGALREERTAARVFALCALGRRDEARAEAQRFVESAPRSPLAARVRAACPPGESPAAKTE
jgi:hypothetical protein